MVLVYFFKGSFEDLFSMVMLFFLFIFWFLLFDKYWRSFIDHTFSIGYNRRYSLNLFTWTNLFLFLKLLPLFLEIKLLSFNILLFLKDFMLKLIHSIKPFSKIVLVSHIIRQQNIVLIVPCFVHFWNLLFILRNWDKKLRFRSLLQLGLSFKHWYWVT